MVRKKAAPKPTHQYIRSALRKVWLYSQERRDALGKARVQRGIYQCGKCSHYFNSGEVEIDHIIPVGASPGSRYATSETNWDDWIGRLFCDPSNLVVLCRECHAEKTTDERNKRIASK